jgi:hypothetical protein
MKKIITQLTANNQVKTRYVNRPNCLKGKIPTDLSGTRALEQYAHMQYEVENINKILTYGCKEYNVTSVHKTVIEQKSIWGADNQDLNFDTAHIERKSEIARASRLAEEIEYYCEKSGKIVKESYKSLTAVKRRVLDIISKNQQAVSATRSWGKPQKLKRFSLNAKQRILEAGAVTDRDCGKENSYEVTVTIPGSGCSVYRAVADWSGWIVNRQTQIIRRLEAKGVQVYWFFVWEHQKRGALHQHWCIAVPGNSEKAEIIANKIRDKWFQLLEELTVKTGVDLFAKKKGFGTWRYTPGAWQSSVNPIRKSVAAYFSKYASKNVATSRYNQRRRDSAKNRDEKNGIEPSNTGLHNLCPSRYWGSGGRIKRRCEQLRVTIEFTVFDPQEADFIVKALHDLASQAVTILSLVSRRFKVVDPQTDFIYAQGYEERFWFPPESYDIVFRLFTRIKNHPERKTDSIGAVFDLLCL